ncbi:MAG: FAD-dependent oxidoreductase, partial [Myxococcota bacterium]
GEQKRVLRMIPGLQNAEFLRLGAIHRNTYLDSPALLDPQLRLRSEPRIRFAGQITGVEGYVESAACGLMVGRSVASELAGGSWVMPPRTTALGALMSHVVGETRLEGRPHEPQNVNWGMFPRVEGAKKKEQKLARVRRAFEHFELWAKDHGVELASSHIVPKVLDRDGATMAG